jgi:hypothetical protein
MFYFLLGLAVLVVVLIAAHGFTRANPTKVARQMKTGGGIFAIAGAAALGLRGHVSLAVPLAMLGYWLMFGSKPPAWATARTHRSPGQTSRIDTDFLSMELDHDSGEIHGEVIRGRFQGRPIESLRPAEMALLWQDCRFEDPASAEVIEAYLDRAHPDWREHMARAEESPRPSDGARMSREEAFDILGLAPGASAEDIRRAHRELMLKLHPDRGGSTYLAAKINEAKDVLLG